MINFHLIFIFHIFLSLNEGAEYAEVPFQKYGVMLSQKKFGDFPSEVFPMVLFGEKFLCRLPSEKEILFGHNVVYPHISVLTERINFMPCLIRRQSQWTYIVCPYVIHRIHNHNFTRNILGVRYRDNYNRKNLVGFWGKGEKMVFTRHFTGVGACDESSKDVQTIIWYFCRQSKEENIGFLQEISPIEYEIHIFTPRVCSEIDFESTTGYKLQCSADKDAMELLLANKDRIESPRYSFRYDFLNSPKGVRGDLFFVRNADIKVKEDHGNENAANVREEEICEKKSVYRADELMSVSMGLPFNFSINPKNQSGGLVFYPFYQR